MDFSCDRVVEEFCSDKPVAGSRRYERAAQRPNAKTDESFALLEVAA